MKKIIISIVFIILTAYASIGQTHETNESLIEGPVFVAVEQMPNFPGGNVKLMEYIGSHLQYPKVAQDKGIQGRVIVSFVVNTDGSISDAEIVRSLDPSCDEEVLRLVNSMPRWIPGKTDGKNVRVQYTMPLMFKMF